MEWKSKAGGRMIDEGRENKEKERVKFREWEKRDEK